MKTIWLLQDGEPLPIDEKPRQMRTALLAEALLESGHSVVWFSSIINHAKHERRPFTLGAHSVQGTLYEVVLLQGVTYKSNFSPLRVLSQAIGGIDFFFTARKLPAPDLIVASYPSPELCFAGALYSKRKQIPFMMDVRDSWPDTFSSYARGIKKLLVSILSVVYLFLFRYSASKAHKLVASTNLFLSWAQQETDSAAVRDGDVLYLGYPDTCQQSDFSFRIEKETFDVVFVASFGRSYDGLRFIEIARRVAERSDAKIKFYFIGDGEEREAWEAAAQELSDVVFTGWCDAQELHERLLQADVGAILLNEWVHWTVPNKFFEYICYGLAILNSVPGELDEFVDSAGIGLTLSDDSVDATADYIISLATNAEQRLTVYEKSRALYTEQFMATSVYDEYVGEIEKLIK